MNHHVSFQGYLKIPPKDKETGLGDELCNKSIAYSSVPWVGHQACMQAQTPLDCSGEGLTGKKPARKRTPGAGGLQEGDARGRGPGSSLPGNGLQVGPDG